MNSKRMFFVMIGLCALLGLASVGVVVTGNKLLQKEAGRLRDLKLEDRLLDGKQAALTQAKNDLERYEQLEHVSKTVVPQDKDQARAVREIVALAREAGISLNSISFPSSTLCSRPAPAKPSGEGDSGASSAPKTAPISQAKPVEGISGVFALEMVITPEDEQNITYYQLLEFLKKLENNRRTAQVTSVRITPRSENASNPYVNFTLTINIFVKP